VSFALSGAHGNNVVTAKDPLKADAAGGIPAAWPRRRWRPTTTCANRDHDGERPGADRTHRPVGPPQDSVATTQFTLSAVDVLVVPWLGGHAHPRALTTFRVVGWEPFRKVYAHYFLNGKRIKTVRSARSAGRAAT
jgi:hypothetical protein